MPIAFTLSLCAVLSTATPAIRLVPTKAAAVRPPASTDKEFVLLTT